MFSYAFTTRELNIVLLEGKTSLNPFLDGMVHPLQKHRENLFCYTILAQVWATPSSKKKVGLNFFGKNLIERSENVDFGEGGCVMAECNFSRGVIIFWENGKIHKHSIKNNYSNLL